MRIIFENEEGAIVPYSGKFSAQFPPKSVGVKRIPSRGGRIIAKMEPPRKI